MSRNVNLDCACCGRTLQVDRHTEGGTYAVNGSDEASLNITYNYSVYYYEYLDIDGDRGITALYGQAAKHVIERMKRAHAQILADEKVEYAEQKRWGQNGAAWEPDNYWCPTKKNAARALAILIGWAERYPAGVFSGD